MRPGFADLSMLRLLLFLLPLGLDTLGISVSLGIKSSRAGTAKGEKKTPAFPLWLRSALLFSLAETAMPLVGLAIGYAASLVISGVMHFVGPLLLIGVGLWELQEEVRERLAKGKEYRLKPLPNASVPSSQAVEADKQFHWGRQLLLALSVSLDELAVGFSLGTVTANAASGRSLSPITLCIFVGLQGFLMALIGITLGRSLRSRLKFVKDWSEILSGFLLIGLGIWLLVT